MIFILKYIFIILFLFPPAVISNAYWVYFKDKGEIEKSDYIPLAKQVISERSLRKKHIDYSDLPLNSDYIRQIRYTGAKVKQKSRWFNAVSVYADEFQLKKISNYTFIRKIESVNFKDLGMQETDIEELLRNNIEITVDDMNDIDIVE